MAVWEYKVISSGKGGFATPALLESFLNQLGSEEWEIVEFRGQPDNPLAFSGLARRPTQRDWTLGDAAAAAAKVEADKLREEFEAKFRSATAAPAAGAGAREAEAPQPQGDSRETTGSGAFATPSGTPIPMRPNDRPGGRLGQARAGGRAPDLLRGHPAPPSQEPARARASRWASTTLPRSGTSPRHEVVGALKECGLEIPEDEDAKVTYVDYDGDLYWVNINRRGELWINTKEKTRPVFRTVQATKVEAEESAEASEPEKRAREPATRNASTPEAARGRGRARGRPRRPLPEGAALLDRIRPLMRRNRREPGGSGSMSFLSRALKCSEATLDRAFTAMGLSAQAAAGDPPVFVEIGDESWWLNKDSRGGIWINAREKRARPPGSRAPVPRRRPAPGAAVPAPAPGNVFAAVRLLLKETKTGAVAAPVERLAGELGKSVDELLAALTASGLRVPEKPREKPVFGEHAGEIFWLNLNAKGRALAQRQGLQVLGGRRKGRRPKKSTDEAGGVAEGAEAPADMAP